MKLRNLFAYALIAALLSQHTYAFATDTKPMTNVAVTDISKPFLIKGEIPCPTADTWPLTTTILNMDPPVTTDPTTSPVNALTVNNIPFNPELKKSINRSGGGCTIAISFYGFVVRKRGGFFIEFERWANEPFIKAEQEMKSIETTEDLLNDKRWSEAATTAPEAYKDETNRVIAFLKEYDNCQNKRNREAEQCYQMLLDRQQKELPKRLPFSEQFVQGINEKIEVVSTIVREEKQIREAKEKLKEKKLAEAELDRRIQQKRAEEKKLERRTREKEEAQKKKREGAVQKAPDRKAEEQPGKQKNKTFGMTSEQFRVSFNKIISKINPDYKIAELDIKSGPIKDTFTRSIDDRLGIVGTVNKSDGLLEGLIVITSGGPPEEAVKIISVMVSSAQALNPNSDNGNIITRLTTAAFDNFNAGLDKAEEERVGDCLYTVSVSEMGLWFTISKP